MSELMDLYDENKEKLNKVVNREDREFINEGEYTITVHCFIINSNKEVLLTQRSLNKNRGGKWEDTHGGLRAGESSIEGIIRELSEEIGIKVNPTELKFYASIKKKRKFKDIYLLYKDIPIESIKFSDSEVMNCKYVTIDTLKNMIENGECTFKKFEDTIFYNSDII